MNADADLERTGEPCLQGMHGFDNPKPGPYGAHRIILMRGGIAKVDEQPIAEILRNMAVKTVNHRGAGVLVGAHDFPVLFGVELAESCVEPTRSQNITVNWRRSASGGRAD